MLLQRINTRRQRNRNIHPYNPTLAARLGSWNHRLGNFDCTVTKHTPGPCHATRDYLPTYRIYSAVRTPSSKLKTALLTEPELLFSPTGVWPACCVHAVLTAVPHVAAAFATIPTLASVGANTRSEEHTS